MLKIELDLTTHCIETATKRYYDRLLSEYFRTKGENAALEEKLDFLQKVLKGFDFSALRNLHSELAGRSNVQVALVYDGNGLPSTTIEDRPIDIKSYVGEEKPFVKDAE